MIDDPWNMRGELELNQRSALERLSYEREPRRKTNLKLLGERLQLARK